MFYRLFVVDHETGAEIQTAAFKRLSDAQLFAEIAAHDTRIYPVIKRCGKTNCRKCKTSLLLCVCYKPRGLVKKTFLPR